LNSNQLICATVNGEHRIYQGPGYHFVVGVTDRIWKPQVIGEDVNFGPIKIIFVKPGRLKFVTYRNTGKPQLLGPGMHYFNDQNLEVGNEIDMNFKGDNQVVKCDTAGAFQFVFVKAGSVAIVILRDGSLSVFQPGLHFLQSPDALKTFVSVQQEHFKFGTCDSQQNFLTADNIELHINATIFYRLVDVVTLFTARIKDEKDLYETLHTQAMSTLLTIIRSETFQGIGKKQQVKNMNKEIRAKQLQSDEDDAIYFYNDNDRSAAFKSIAPTIALPAPSLVTATPISGLSSTRDKPSDVLESITMGFQNIIHDAEPQFQRMMQNNFSASGVEIQSLRIEQIEFADKTMQKQVSEFAMTNTKLQSQQQTISAQRAIQIAEAERDASTLLIKTKAETDTKLMTARADADKKMILADTDNQIKTKTAKADAENILILADAEAKSKIKIGEAEIQIMEKQNAMPNAQLRIFTDAQKEVFSGVSKVIYTDQQSLLLKPFLNLPDLSGGGDVNKR